MLNFVSKMQYVITKTDGHGFARGEVVKIIQIVSDDTFIACNDEGKFWAVKKDQLVRYVKYPDNGNKYGK